MDFILGFVFGVYFWWAIAVISIVAVVFDYNENTFWSIVFSLTAIVLLVANKDININYWYLLAYPFIGFFWSFWRYKSYLTQKVKKRLVEIETTYEKRLNNLTSISNRHWSDEEKEKHEKDNSVLKNGEITTLKESLDPVKHIDKIVYWIVFWPISFIANFSKDIILFVKDFVENYLIGFYKSALNKVFDKALKNI